MATQKVSNERKKELEQMDPFQENLIKAVGFLKEYKKQCVMAVGAVIAVIMIFSGILYSLKTSEEAAAVLVSNALTKYAKVNDPEKGFGEVKQDFDILFKEYGNTGAGKQARVVFAKICYDASKFDLSYAHYEQALKLFKGDDLMENLLNASLGHVAIALKQYENAEKAFLKIQKSDNTLLKDEAGYALGMLHDHAKDRSKSKEMYQRIISNHPDSMYSPIAKSRIQ